MNSGREPNPVTATARYVKAAITKDWLFL